MRRVEDIVVEMVAPLMLVTGTIWTIQGLTYAEKPVATAHSYETPRKIDYAFFHTVAGLYLAGTGAAHCFLQPRRKNQPPWD